MSKSIDVWMGKIPESWQIKRLRFVLCERKETNNPVQTDFILSLTNDRGVIPYNEKGDIGNKSKEDVSGYKIARKGDIVLNSMNVIIGSVGLSNYDGAVSPVYYMLYPIDSKKYSVYYYNYVFQTKMFQDSLRGYGNGILEIRMRIPMQNLQQVKLPIPPKDEQDKIVAFLDEKCERIDKVTKKLEKQIEVLEEYKNSVITEAVTKGLNPTAPMKDSGVKWVGKIPENWNVKPLYCFFNERKNKNSLGKETNLLSLSYGNIIRKSIDTTGGLLPENFNGYNIIEKNDIVMRLTDLQNDKRSLRTGLSTERGIITSAYVTLKPAKKINSEYFHYLLHAYDIEKVLYNMGNGVRQGLNYSELSKLMLLEPAIEEQNKIAEYLNDKINKIDTIKKQKQKAIETLNEYKKSLIFEYVTGKKEVA